MDIEEVAKLSNDFMSAAKSLYMSKEQVSQVAWRWI